MLWNVRSVRHPRLFGDMPCPAQPLNVVAAICAVFAWLALSDVCPHPTSPRDGCSRWILCLLTRMASTFTVMRFALTPCRVLVNRLNKHRTDSVFSIFISILSLLPSRPCSRTHFNRTAGQTFLNVCIANRLTQAEVPSQHLCLND